MHAGNLVVFAQIMEFAPWKTFVRLVAKYQGDPNTRTFRCFDQFLYMAFTELTYRESLRDIEACLLAQPSKLYHLGFRGNITRSNLADANDGRDWRIYADFAQTLIRTPRRLYATEPLAVDLEETVYALDSTTIDLRLSLFPWAPFRDAKATIKMHTLIDLPGSIPASINDADRNVHHVNAMDVMPAEPGAIYVVDHGDVACNRLFALLTIGSTFSVNRGRSIF
jgi:transposase, IS4 family